MNAAQEQEYVMALGAEEWARRKREDRAAGAAFEARLAPVLAEQGYRWPRDGEKGSFVWLKIDDRTIDDGLCKVYVVALA